MNRRASIRPRPISQSYTQERAIRCRVLQIFRDWQRSLRVKCRRRKLRFTALPLPRANLLQVQKVSLEKNCISMPSKPDKTPVITNADLFLSSIFQLNRKVTNMRYLSFFHPQSFRKKI